MIEKKICFFIEEKRFIDFKLRLRHDGFTQSVFISAVVDLYLENEEASQILLEKMSDLSKFGAKRRAKTMDNYKKGNNTLEQYHSVNDTDAIYDILEKEIGDL